MLLFTATDHANSPACHDSLCEQNENGWAAEIIKLAKQYNVHLPDMPFDTLDVQAICDKKTKIEGERDIARVSQYTICAGSVMKEPSLEDLRYIAQLEGSAPGARGKGRQTWKFEDDFDTYKHRFWKKWSWRQEFDSYVRENKYLLPRWHEVNSLTTELNEGGAFRYWGQATLIGGRIYDSTWKPDPKIYDVTSLSSVESFIRRGVPIEPSMEGVKRVSAAPSSEQIREKNLEKRQYLKKKMLGDITNAVEKVFF